LEALVPNKTIYVSDDDAPLYRRAQELAGGNLSAAIAVALRRYVEMEEGQKEGYDEITVTVGTGAGRKVRFAGVLLGEWAHTTSRRVEKIRVYRSRTGKFVVHTERSPEWTTPDGDKWSTGWRAWIGNWSPNQEWSFTSGEATLKVADTIEAVRDLVPPELYEIVSAIAEQPPVEDLDI
jgi:EXLDI family protein